jgi:hypothetical protein
MTPETLARMWHAAQENVLPGYASPASGRRCEWEELSIVGRSFMGATAEIVLGQMRQCSTSSECNWPAVIEMEFRAGTGGPWMTEHSYVCRKHADWFVAKDLGRPVDIIDVGVP